MNQSLRSWLAKAVGDIAQSLSGAGEFVGVFPLHEVSACAVVTASQA